jgi:hypothetical protein
MTELAVLIEHLSNRWMQAWIEHDRGALEMILAPDFELVSSATPARRIDRQSWLAGALGPYRCRVFRYRDVQVRDLGDGYALMSALGGQIAELGGVDRSGAFFITDVWRSSAAGDWQVCSRHTAHPEPSGPAAAALARLST